ncbi:iron-sulfur cluster repair di-iron protein [Natronorubrum sp. DTA28]|uniref:iron-sulfur cluster repair di-iron protein n=1 Tax=Natronorubrum sp. DTA28 TaxID=3447019 RepID=UPI003F82819F
MTSTIDPETNLGQLVRVHPEFAPVFESLGIDYCCGGDTPLAQACEENGLEVQPTLERLADAQSTDSTDPTDASLSELVDDIVETHHDYLRSELPSLERTVRKVARVHGESHPELEAIESEFLALETDVMEHIADEEETVFPEIVTLDDETARTDAEADRIRDAIDHLESDHDAAASHLEAIRRLSDDYAVPEDACTSYRNMLDRLQLLEADLHAHIHTENNVLFPDAEAALASA